MRGKHFALTGLISILLTLIVAPTSTQQGAGNYDPWYDMNDDGIIDIWDIASVAIRFGAEGEPFAAKAAVNYTSGWLNITDKAGQYFNITHNLNSTDIIVDIQGKTTLDGGVHQRNFGGMGYTPGWSRIYGGPGGMAMSVVQTADGGFAVAGDGFANLVKTDAYGNLQWNKTYTTGGIASMIQTSSGGFALAGITAGVSTRILLVILDSAGTQQWIRTHAEWPAEEAGRDLVQTIDGGYAIAGYTRLSGFGSEDFRLLKTNATGLKEWNTAYGGSSMDIAYSLVQTSDGGYALAGLTQSFGAGSDDFWLVKTNSSGFTQWSQTYGGVNSDVATDMVQTSDGGYAIAGNTMSFGAGNADFWLVKTDSSGNVQWNKTYGGAGIDGALSVIQTSDGGYALAGSTTSFGAGGADFWLVKTDSYGNALWNRTYGGASDDWGAYSVVETNDRGYALVGYTQSFNSGVNHFWLLKTDVQNGLSWTDSTANTITLYRGATDPWWNYVRVRVWKIKENP